MKAFEQICHQLSAGEFEFSCHSLKRAVERNISDNEIVQAAENAEWIEDYPDDKYSSSFLILGLQEKIVRFIYRYLLRTRQWSGLSLYMNLTP